MGSRRYLVQPLGRGLVSADESNQARDRVLLLNDVYVGDFGMGRKLVFCVTEEDSPNKEADRVCQPTHSVPGEMDAKQERPQGKGLGWGTDCICHHFSLG